MPLPSVEQVERCVGDSLRILRAQFAQALQNKPGEAGISILGTELRVDQIREVAISDEGSDDWIVRNGRQFISTDTITGPTILRMVIGRDRALYSDSFAQFLADLYVGHPRWPAGGFVTASFVNLAIAEPYVHPERELPIFVAVAHKLATGKVGDNLYREIPDLITSYDILHDEISRNSFRADALLPNASPVSADTLLEYQMHLLAAAFPRSRDAIAAASTDAARTALFVAYESSLRQYVRDHLFAKVATLVSEFE